MVPARGDPLPAPFGPRPASQLLQIALRAGFERQDALDETATCLDELAAELRWRARTGSVVDALVVALAEPGGTALTGDKANIEALAAHARDVSVELI
jgi:hypothetical protein